MVSTHVDSLRSWVASFRGWAVITLVLSGIRILGDLLVFAAIFGLKHRLPGSDRMVHDLISHAMGCAALAWVFRYPFRAWVILIAADLLSSLALGIVTAGVILALHTDLPGPATDMTLLLVPRVLSVAGVMIWARRDAGRTPWPFS